MKNGGFIRLLALVLAIVMVGVLVVQFAMSYEDFAEDRKEFRSDKRDHEKTHDTRAEMRDCSTCENYEEREDYYNERALSLVLSLLQSVALYLTFTGILFAAGVIIGKMPGRKPSAPQVTEE